jgi:ribosomal protein L7Ae-like RNA K-turn-binding protein
MPKRHNNTIYKLSLGIKKTIKAILSSITKIKLIILIEDSKEALSINHVHIKEETTIADIATTTYSIRSDVIFIINLDTS